jgi:hypothetical protein
MSSFCPAETTPITKANYMNTYSRPANIPSCVPPLPTANSNGTFNYTGSVLRADGTVDSAVLNSFVVTFMGSVSPPSTLMPATPNNPAKNFATKSNALRSSMQAEYCWYYNRYVWALTQVLTAASQSGGVVDPQMKNNTAVLNNKLNGILLVMKASVNSRLNTLKDYYDTDINSQNSELDNARQRLKDHSQLLGKNDLQSDVQAAMVDYSIEKNSSSRNLLAVYGFMNIVAVGLLFYLYTHTKE